MEQQDPVQQDNPQTEVAEASDGGLELQDAFDKALSDGGGLEEKDAGAEAAQTEATATDTEATDEAPKPAEAAPAKDPTEMNVDELKAWIDANPNNAKSYAHIQAAFTRSQQENSALQKELESFGGLDAVKAAMQDYQGLYQVLAQNPEKLNAVRAILGTQKQDNQNQLPEGLQDDPLFQYLAPQLKELNEKLSAHDQFVQTEEQARQNQQAEQMVDKALQTAYSRYKAHFGEDPGKEAKTQIIKAMQERKIYQHTDALVDNLFMDKIAEAKVQAALAAHNDKARKNPSMKTVNSSATTEGPAIGNMDPEEAFEAAFAMGGDALI